MSPTPVFPWDYWLFICILAFARSQTCDQSRRYPAPINVEAIYKPKDRIIRVQWEDAHGHDSTQFNLRIRQGGQQEDETLYEKSYDIPDAKFNATYQLSVIGSACRRVDSDWSGPLIVKTLPRVVVIRKGDKGWISLEGASNTSTIWSVKLEGKELLTVVNCSVSYHMVSGIGVDLLEDCIKINITFFKIYPHHAGIYEVEQQWNKRRLYAKTVVVTERPSTPSLRIQTPVVGSSVRLGCSSKSRSKPDYHNLRLSYIWRVNETNISNSATYDVDRDILIIRKFQLGDTMNRYSCIATEEQGMKSYPNNIILKDVLYGPQNVEISPARNVTLIAGRDSATFTCSADCRPACTITWERKASTDTHFVPVQSGNDPLFLSPRDRRAASLYRCRAVAASPVPDSLSDICSVVISVDIQSVPDSSSNFTAPNIVSNQVILTWMPRDDGGFEQVFHIDMKDTVNSEGWRMIKSGIPDNHQNQMMFVILQDLIPSTNYTFRLYSENRIGQSNMSYLSVTTSLPEIEKDGWVSENDFFKVGFIIESVILLLLICVCVPVLAIKRKGIQRKGEDKTDCQIYDLPGDEYELPLDSRRYDVPVHNSQYENTAQHRGQRENELRGGPYANLPLSGTKHDNPSIYEN